MVKDKEFVVDFADGGISSFINVVKLSDNIKYDKRDGLLYCYNAILGHVGVQKYYDHELGGLSNRIVKVHKLKEDFLDEDSIATLEGKSLTLNHPRDENGRIKFVDGTNYKDLEKGTVLKAWADGDTLYGNLVVKDPDVIMDILDGKLKSLSLGYNAKIEKYGDNDLKQVNFYFNHLSFVPKGRAVNAQIVDEDTVGEENSMTVWEKIKSVFSPKEGEQVSFNDEEQVIDFGDEKHKTHSVRIIESTYEYDDETRESVDEVKTHEVTKHTHEDSDKKELDGVPRVGDEESTKVEEPKEDVETVVEEDKGEVEVAVVDEDTSKQEQEDEVSTTSTDENKEVEKEKEEREFGDESMNEEQLKALKEQMKKELIDEIKANKDAFADINPITPQEEGKKGYQIDFKLEEELKKKFYNMATNPVAHGGDFNKMNDFRKKAFN